MAPFFSIGVTAYNRNELLRHALDAIFGQTFGDFEVILGNDYVKEPLSREMLGIRDPRIRIINNRHNLGEAANRNNLLRSAQGLYFTWLSDDDLYAPNFLAVARDAIDQFKSPRCVFTSIGTVRGTESLRVAPAASRGSRCYSGRDFLRHYLRGELRIMGINGIFKKSYLEGVGGMQKLCDAPVALYAEYALVLECGLLERVAYVDAPAVFFRFHEESWTGVNAEAHHYRIAAENLIVRSIQVLRRPPLRSDFCRNLTPILKMVITNYASKLKARDGYLDGLELRRFLSSLKAQLSALKGSGSYWIALAALQRASLGPSLQILRRTLREVTPCFLVPVVRAARMAGAAAVRGVKRADQHSTPGRRRDFWR